MPGRITGRYQTIRTEEEEVRSFVPYPLPPTAPPIGIEGALAQRAQAGQQALVRLELAGAMVPSLDWFLYAFVRKEAVVSSQIEGTQATLLDLLNHEAAADIEVPAPNADVQDVCNYVEALSFARRQLSSSDGLPLSMRLLNGAHALLLKGARGSNKQPGEVRRSQNWIGGSRPGNAIYVPPAPEEIPELLSDLERYLHRPDTLPALVRAGLVHVQFETIHPYLDGNGRIGRLLVSLLLEHWGLLTKPLLYLSLYFKRNQQEYYRRLNAVRVEGDWEGWLEYFLEGVTQISDEAVDASRKLFSLVCQDRSKVLGRRGATLPALQLFERLPTHPIVSNSWVVEAMATSKPTANRAISVLEQAGVLVEATGKRRDRTWTYRAYLDLLRVGTELSG